MSKNKAHWIKSPWTIGITTVVLGFILSMVHDYFKEIQFLTSLLSILRWAVNLIWTILDFDLKVWWVIGGLLLFILIIYFILKFEKEEIPKPEFYNYREDKFKLWRWSWEWYWSNTTKEWIILNLKAHCPKCDTKMQNHTVQNFLWFECPRCDLEATETYCDNQEKIERIILDNIDRKLYDKKNTQYQTS
jgi:Ca2+/Na+ antiporter